VKGRGEVREGGREEGKGLEGMRGNSRGRDPQLGKDWLTPHIQNPEKCSDCRTDLIGWGGKTDVCPGQQTPSHHHCPEDN